jgi:hypothetical protein
VSIARAIALAVLMFFAYQYGKDVGRLEAMRDEIDRRYAEMLEECRRDGWVPVCDEIAAKAAKR